MLDLEYVTVSPISGTTNVEIYAKFKERVNGKIYFALQIKRGNLTF